MARIDKMRIQGIRSFGPNDENAQNITFYSPITCIVGQNGCGKTTIIECLRYATTGNPPPSTTGGKSFVYDPKLTNGGEVKGQVKLQFVNLKGEKMAVTRTLQVTQRLGKLESKTVDPLLHMFDERGDVKSVGGRCLDIKKLVLSNMGISEAILDNVIFCHQDDSLWPLDEGKKLKEKFDEIFDATKYNKASDMISKLHKTKQTELKLGVERLHGLEDRHREARKKQNELQKNVADHADAVAKMEELEKERKPKIEAYRKVCEREQKYTELQSQISAKETEKRNLEEQQRELRSKIKLSQPHDGPREDLERKIRDFQGELRTKKDEIAELEGKVTELIQQEKDNQTRIGRSQTNLGQLQSEEDTYKLTKRQRLEALHNLAKDLNLHGLKDQELSSKADVDDALKQVDKGVKAKERELQILKKDQDEEEKKLQADVTIKFLEQERVNGKIQDLESQAAICSEDLQKAEDEISQVDKAVSQIKVLKTRLERANKEYEDVLQEMNSEETQNEITDTQERRNRLEDEVKVLDQEVEVLQQSSILQSEVDVHKSSLASKEAELAQLKEIRRDDLVLLFKDIPQRGLRAQVEGAIKENEGKIKDLRKHLENAQKQQTKLESEVKHLQAKVTEAENLMEKHLSAIQEECGNKDFDTTLTEVEEEERKSQDQKGVLDSSEILFSRYISSLKQKNPCCPLCHRDFKAIQETEKLIAELRGKMETLPVQKVDVKSKLEDLKARRTRLIQLKPAKIKATELRSTEIPKLKEQLENCQMMLDTASTECVVLKSQLTEPEKKLLVAQSLRSDAALMEQHENEIKKLTREIQSIEQRLPRTGTGRNLQDARDELKQLRNEVQVLQKQAEQKQRELDTYQKKVANLRENRNAINEQLLKVESGAQKRATTLQRCDELKEKRARLNEELDTVWKSHQPAIDAHKSAELKLNQVKDNNKKNHDQKSEELRHLQNRADNLKKINTAVENYEAHGKEAQLEALKASVQKLESQRDQLAKKKQDLRSQIDGLKEDLASQEVRSRELDDNLSMLKKRELCEKVVEDLNRLRAQIGTLDLANLMKEKSALNNQILKIGTDISTIEGKIEILAGVIKAIEAELEEPRLKFAEQSYKKQLVQNAVLKHVISDLLKYFKALNQAMIHFHQERMETVNRIIRELWVSIYKGSDIDYIAIRTDSEQSNRTASTARRTYNYRVVMVKRDTELDMRGRCSAGQKMLASLVIRIALAETFSANCGILALDEPTTNLDHNNIDSLCGALTELAQNHRFQNNFQLIVITHDENFINQLTQAGLVNYFYRVSRNEEAHSTVTKFRVGEFD